MNWFKRFFRDRHEQDVKKFGKEQNVPEELITKVTYRYPKRNFRFPIDLDQRISHIQDEIHKEKTHIKNTADIHARDQRINNQKATSTVDRVPYYTGYRKKTSPTETIEKRPFRPTEVPPPFFKRKQKEQETDQEPVVFELTPFFNTEKVDVEKETRTFVHSGKDSQNPSIESARPGEITGEQGIDRDEETDETNERSVSQFNDPISSTAHDGEKVSNYGESLDGRGLNTQPIISSHLLPKTPDQQSEKTFASKAISFPEYPRYQFPPLALLKRPLKRIANHEWVDRQTKILNRTFASFQVAAKVVGISEGPRVTRFEIAPDVGVKVSKITSLTDDIQLSLATNEIRIEAPIPGKHTIGIEVPNPDPRPVYLREILEDKTFVKSPSPLTVALGLDITGMPIIANLKEMPHGLIAGATGSGKSVAINTIIISLLYKARPDELKLLLIDPKMVELTPYNDIPHLISPVITNSKAATAALKWAVEEMERRYELFAKTGARNIKRYNKRIQEKEKLPYIVIIIDELADLMMVAPNDVEEAIARLAQKARACGIHLLIATQRPSVDVITGLIKANIPTRIAFSVSSQVDSRTILDMSGAERLLGAGDMLYLPNGSAKPIRIQGAFISDEEIEKVVHYVKKQGVPQYVFAEQELLQEANNEEMDELFIPACEYAVEIGQISTSALQRKFRIGYNRAARLIDLMEEKGMISEQKGGKPRDVLLSKQELEYLKQNDPM